MLSTRLSAQSIGRSAAPGPGCAGLQLPRACDGRCKRAERRRAAQRGDRLAAAAAAPEPPAGSVDSEAAVAAAAADQPTPLSSRPLPPASLLLRAVAQVLALAAALSCLILLPAHVSGRLARQPLQAAACYSLYLLFFASGTISRMLLHGRLAEARQDAQRSSGGARLALLLFAAVVVPAGHWEAWWDPTLPHLAATAPRAAAAAAWLLPLVGYSLMLGGWVLNAAAAAALGKAYNRVVAPDELVTTGPYALVQHPIYTSYMLLFAGHALSLGSPAAAALLLAGCLWYYSGRTRLEEAVLDGAFGERYRQYRRSTGHFLPRLLR